MLRCAGGERSLWRWTSYRALVSSSSWVEIEDIIENGVLPSEFWDALHDAIAAQACGSPTRGEGLTEVNPYRRSPRAGRHAKNTP